MVNSAKFELTKFELETKSPAELIAERQSVVSQIINEGHVLGSHSHRHKFHNRFAKDTQDWRMLRESLAKQEKSDTLRYYFKSETDMHASVKDSLSILQNIAKSRIRFIRMPFGAGFFTTGNPREMDGGLSLRCLLKDQSLTHVLWQVDSEDYAHHKEQPLGSLALDGKLKRIKAHVAQQICLQGGGIVLFHDSNPFTAESLPHVIQELKKSNHQFVDLATISQNKAAARAIKFGDDLLREDETCQ